MYSKSSRVERYKSLIVNISPRHVDFVWKNILQSSNAYCYAGGKQKQGWYKRGRNYYLKGAWLYTFNAVVYTF